jgi:hypothetical protein
MSSDNEDKSSINKSALNRRNMLLGGTTLAAATAIVTSAPIAATQAQAQQPAPSGSLSVHRDIQGIPAPLVPAEFRADDDHGTDDGRYQRRTEAELGR